MFSGDQLKYAGMPYYGPASSASSAEITAPTPFSTGDGYTPIAEYAEAPRLLSAQEILARMQANRCIPIANGFVLAPDFAPAGLENEFIPQEEYTWYFWNGIAPYASTGQHQEHDQKHALTYYRLFQSPTFAACVRESAGMSYSNGRSFYFTKAMDLLGDNFTLLVTCERPDAEKDYGHILDARLHLRRLIQLREQEYSTTDHRLSWQQNQLFGQIWYETDFAQLEARVDADFMALPERKQAEILDLYTPIAS